MALNLNKETHRPEVNFSPSLWGDHFINYNSDPLVIQKYSKKVEVLKNEVRSMLIAPDSKMLDTMNLIDTLERLGVSYHFENEIEEKLQQFFHLNTDYHDVEAYDLHTVALHFRLFRQHGHRISSEIFGKWKHVNGEFKEGVKGDAKGLLSLYEASHLRTHGETILDDALAFTTANLKSMAPNLGSSLRKQVFHALVQPLHLGIPRVEARNFISMYEEEEHKNESLLTFAKLDYNLLQMLHKEELCQVSRWWKELGLISQLPYARDRVVECFFWTLGVHHEPHYSRGRIMLAKTIAMISVIDDTYDAYGTIQELDVFTEAIQRWDNGEIARLPQYMRPLYKALLDLYEQFEEQLAKEGRSYAAYYSIEAEIVRCYHVEAKWFIEGYLPPFEEYLNNALITSTYCYLTTSSFMGVECALKEDFEWLSKKPKMLVAALTICRFIDDIATYEIEKERGQVATGVECYMRENGVTKEEAMAKFMEIATNAWKDSNEEYLRPSRNILTHILNLERIVDVTYKNNEDGYTQPEKNVFGGGTETTAVALPWILPSTMKKAQQEEIRSLVGEKGRVDEDDIEELEYLKAVIKEALRLYPPVPLSLPRETTQKCNIYGYEIQRKTVVYVNAWAIGRDPEFWENPNEFVPERFLTSTIDFKGQDFGLIPFGSGRRICPELPLAIASLEVALANLLYSFDWGLPDGMSEDDIDTEAVLGISMRKKNDLRLVANKYVYSCF